MYACVYIQRHPLWHRRRRRRRSIGTRNSAHTYRGTLLTRKRTPLGPYSRTMPRVLGGS